MNSSGTTRGVAATAIAALAVTGLPLFVGPAHAVVDEVVIDNTRDRDNFDLDELRDGDDFTIETREAGALSGGTAPTYRWVIPAGGGGAEVIGDWMTAEDKAGRPPGIWRVLGPSRTKVQAGTADGIRDRQLRAGTWTLEARVGTDAAAVAADPMPVPVSESEITFAGGPANPAAQGRHTVTGTLGNAQGGLEGRAVKLSYTRLTRGDAVITSDKTVLTGPDGGFEVDLRDPSGAAGETGTLKAVAIGEEEGDQTQLPHRYGPDDATRPDADATDTLKVTWGEGGGPQRIAASLKGRSNGARADVLKVVAPTAARGATVRLFKAAAGGRLAPLQTRQLNQKGDKTFRVKDRNRGRATTYIAKVGATKMTMRDDTNRRRVR